MIERQEESQETESLWSINPCRRAMYLARLREVFADVLLTDDARVFVGARGGLVDVTDDLLFADAGVEIDADDPDELIWLLHTGLGIEPGRTDAESAIFDRYFTPEYVAYAAECRAAMRS